MTQSLHRLSLWLSPGGSAPNTSPPGAGPSSPTVSATAASDGASPAGAAVDSAGPSLPSIPRAERPANSTPLTDQAASSATPSLELAPLAHLYGTRLRNNIRQAKVRSDGTVTYSAIKTSPTSYTTAMADPLWRSGHE
jgi:hypothetical protein